MADNGCRSRERRHEFRYPLSAITLPERCAACDEIKRNRTRVRINRVILARFTHQQRRTFAVGGCGCRVSYSCGERDENVGFTQIDSDVLYGFSSRIRTGQFNECSVLQSSIELAQVWFLEHQVPEDGCDQSVRAGVCRLLITRHRRPRFCHVSAQERTFLMIVACNGGTSFDERQSIHK